MIEGTTIRMTFMGCINISPITTQIRVETDMIMKISMMDRPPFLSGNAEDLARLFVAFFQVQRHGKILREPQRQSRQLLPDGERRGPAFQQPCFAYSSVATGCCVKVQRFRA